MNSAQRRKLTAGAGLVAMLLGALMVLAPVGAGADTPTPVLNPQGNDNPSCRFLGYPIEAKYDTQASAPSSGQASGSATVDGTTYTLIVDWTFHADKTISFEVHEDSDVWVSAAIVKQAAANAGGGANVYIYDPAVESGSGLVDPRDDGQFSHLSFCGEVPEDAGLPTLTVTKKVATSDTFEITVSQDETEVDKQFLGNDESIIVDDAEGDYVISEDVPAGWQTPVIECGSATTSPAEDGLEVTVDGVDVDCTVTNTPVPPPPPPGPTPTPTPEPEVEATSLQVVKVVDGLGAPETWEVDFEVLGASVDEAFSVDNVISSRAFSDVEPGAYEITETLAAGDAGVLTDVTCLDGATEVLTDVDGSTATVVLVEGDDVVCTFTNSYAAVLPDEVVPTTTTVAPATTVPPPEVKGDVVVLPRTGNETRNLTGLGAVLLGLGAALVMGSNRRLVKS